MILQNIPDKAMKNAVKNNPAIFKTSHVPYRDVYPDAPKEEYIMK